MKPGFIVWRRRSRQGCYGSLAYTLALPFLLAPARRRRGLLPLGFHRGNGHPLGLRTEIVVVDRERLLAPETASILEGSHPFLFLGVHTDNRQPLAGKSLALILQVAELTVALRTLRAGKTLAVGVQGVVYLFQQAPHAIGANREAQSPQLGADMRQAQAGPKSPPGHGVTRRFIAEQLPQLAQDGGRLFFRPAVVRLRSACPALGALGHSTIPRAHGRRCSFGAKPNK